MTAEQLSSEGISNEVVEAVKCLTKLPHESRIDAAIHAKQNQIARLVKLADNAENMDLSQISKPTNKDFERLEKYKLVNSILLG